MTMTYFKPGLYFALVPGEKHLLDEFYEKYAESKRLYRGMTVFENTNLKTSEFQLYLFGIMMPHCVSINDPVKISEMLRYISRDLDEYGEDSIFYRNDE